VPLSSSQRLMLEDWMRTKAIVTCPCCGQKDRWRFADAAYVRALLEEGDEDLTEGGGVVKVACDTCGYLMLFDAEIIGIRGVWGRGRSL
jgi:RNase P subunit RPR2